MQKAGLHALTKNLAIELGGDGIRVNSVAPAVTVTPLFGAFIAPDKIEETLTAGFNAFHPIGRVGRPRDLANHIVFLLSDTGLMHRKHAAGRVETLRDPVASRDFHRTVDDLTAVLPDLTDR